MKIGDNEKTILAIIKKFPKINEKQLSNLFTIVTKKKGRIDTITHSLRIKGLINDGDLFSIDKQAIENLDLPQINISHEQVSEIKHVKDVKLGNVGKSIIYILAKTEKSSLQFLSIFLQKPTKNIYAILQRLEDKKTVVSYNSRIRRLNSAGRRYHPKYYILTDNGKIWLEINKNRIRHTDKIDELLKEPEEKIQEYNLKL